MTTAVEVPIEHPGAIYVGGGWRRSGAGTAGVIRPDTEEVLYRIGLANEADMSGAVSAARLAFDEGPWPQMSVGERAEVLHAMAAGLRARQSDLALLWSAQVGAVHSVVATIVPEMADVFDLYAQMSESFPFIEPADTKFSRRVGYRVREPVGVVGAIVPWNGPAPMIAYKVAPALIAGCTVVLKSSVEAPGEAHILAEVAAAAGLPPGVLNVIAADRDVSERLVTDDRVDKIAFTGSTAAGRRIGALCADRIARVTLELGGRSAAIVCDDYDLTRAAVALAKAQCFLSGQACAALTRIIIDRDRHDAFVEALADAFSSVTVGCQFDPAVQMGPLATSVQRDRVERYIALGRAEGAVLATGGGRPVNQERGYFVEPTVFGAFNNASTLAREEIFGPVLTVTAADDERDAVRIANDSPYGLNAAVFTSDSERAYRLSRKLRSGTVGHNGMRVDYGIGFGGFKQSGLGREGGVAGLLPYLESKTVVLDSAPDSLN
ncbi:aldehyde dehydrogenase [Mycolicibacterium setense]|uniref:aldehyde dehydrogenase n=1 Tax=Mycolicibacterium setense TaxID=431269 RepID=UPI0007EB0E55|nr:aldehyde dehydrogenase [Mycolicibacterium setense]OBB14643.1 aldehyde dehydrogenase [Mycolicibacterium setense]